jgi:hypothetical protein
MTKPLISVLLCNALVLFLFTSSLGASFQDEKEAKETADVKARVSKLEIPTLVEIKLRNKTKLKGYVQQISEDHFVVSDLKTDAVTNVKYAEVQRVKRVKTHHMSDFKLSAIVFGVVTVLYLLGNLTNEP